MNLKLIDPKVVASRAALVVAGGSVVALVWWAQSAIQHAQKLQDPVQNVITEQGLLNN